MFCSLSQSKKIASLILSPDTFGAKMSRKVSLWQKFQTLLKHIMSCSKSVCTCHTLVSLLPASTSLVMQISTSWVLNSKVRIFGKIFIKAFDWSHALNHGQKCQSIFWCDFKCNFYKTTKTFTDFIEMTYYMPKIEVIALFDFKKGNILGRELWNVWKMFWYLWCFTIYITKSACIIKYWKLLLLSDFFRSGEYFPFFEWEEESCLLYLEVYWK